MSACYLLATLWDHRLALEHLQATGRINGCFPYYRFTMCVPEPTGRVSVKPFLLLCQQLLCIYDQRLWHTVHGWRHVR